MCIPNSKWTFPLDVNVCVCVGMVPNQTTTKWSALSHERILHTMKCQNKRWRHHACDSSSTKINCNVNKSSVQILDVRFSVIQDLNQRGQKPAEKKNNQNMSKRGAEVLTGDEYLESVKKRKEQEYVKKHTLESDEEDSDADNDRYNILDENDIQGEEDGVAGIEGEVKITPFNMRDEMEEGHFDGDGHFQWNKNKEVKDHWLDNLDWVKIKESDANAYKAAQKDGANGDSSDSDDDDPADGKQKFDAIDTYRRVLVFMQPGESINKTLQRLGKKIEKVSTQERFRRKKLGIVDEHAKLVTELTELTNRILTEMGNMDVYQETYEQIQQKYSSKLKGNAAVLGGPSSSTANDHDDMLDMYADDFDTKEKQTINKPEDGEATAGPSSTVATTTVDANKMTWEFKWKNEDTEIHGPYSSEQMLKFVNDGFFKDGALVRKCGTDSQFYTSNRVDFDLYI